MSTRPRYVWGQSKAGINSKSAQAPLGLRTQTGPLLQAATTKFADFTRRDAEGRVAGWRRSATLAAIGCAAFVMGLLVYLTDRDASRATLIPAVAFLTGSHAFGALGGWLPSFVHTFAFSLFTAAALPERSVPRYGACVAWFAVNVAFELGQHPLVNLRLAEMLNGSFGGTPLTRSLASYFLHGTFDSGDIVAALLGALAAGVVLRLMNRGQEKKHAQ